MSEFTGERVINEHTMCDSIDNAIALQMMRSAEEIYGYIHPPCRVEVNARLSAAALESPRV